MKTKFSLIVAAIAVVALAVPALASAAALTEPANTLVPVGAKILGTSTNATTKTSAGTLACANVTITGEVTQNSAGVVKGIGKGAGTSTTCTVAGKAATVSDITLNSIEAAAGGNKINVTFKALIAGTECHFESTGVAFTYTGGSDSLKITNGDLVGKPAAVCEPGTLNGDFTLETDVSPFTSIILD